MSNTKARHLEILSAAAEQVEQAGGVEAIDDLPQGEKLTLLRKMRKAVIEATDCHQDTAKRNIAKALRRARYGVMKERWGGPRAGSGRPQSIDIEP